MIQFDYLTNIFQMGWNHQLVMHCQVFFIVLQCFLVLGIDDRNLVELESVRLSTCSLRPKMFEKCTYSPEVEHSP